MKLQDFRTRLEESEEFNDAKKELKLQFALADAVLDARIKKGWTQEELAKAIGTKQANISKIEAGLGNPTLNFISKLTKVLDFNINISCDQIKEVQYQIMPIVITSQENQFSYWVEAPQSCHDFDSRPKQSDSQEKVYA